VWLVSCVDLVFVSWVVVVVDGGDEVEISITICKSVCSILRNLYEYFFADDVVDNDDMDLKDGLKFFFMTERPLGLRILFWIVFVEVDVRDEKAEEEEWEYVSSSSAWMIFHVAFAFGLGWDWPRYLTAIIVVVLLLLFIVVMLSIE
jgi:hypothetical protein